MLLTMESKTAAHHKLETLIARGRETAGTVIDHVMKNQPTDRLARASAALEAGYSTPSAFISMFRKTLGTTPALYFRTDVKGR